MNSGSIMDSTRSKVAAGEEFHRRLQLSLLLRVITVTFLLGATVFIHFTRRPSLLTSPLIALYFLSGLTYFFTLISLIALRFTRKLGLYTLFQILWEVFFVSALVYITGGIHSIFSFLYLLAIIMAGTLMQRRGAFLAAAMGSLMYGLVIVGMNRGILPYFIEIEPVGKWSEILYNFFINLAAMFATAVLSSYLTEKLRVAGDELVEVQKDRDTLVAFNENIIRSLSSGLLTLDLRGRITSFNRVACAITGLSEREAMGMDFLRVFPGAAIDNVEDAARSSKRQELVFKDGVGQDRHLEFREAPLRGGEGELLGVLVIFNDVTEMREMEKRLRKSDRLAAVGQLAAGMAHEIRNPLASISGSIQMLAQDQKTDETGGRLMNIVLRETNRLNALITDFLLFARPTPRITQIFRLDELIEEIVEVCGHRPDMGGVAWATEFQGELAMESDPKLIQQIMWNLINNAVAAMPEGGKIIIRVARKENEDEDPFFSIEVEDSGQGIPPELVDRVFDPFFTTRAEGTGLGLAVVFRIVEALDGSIQVATGKAGGAKFVIRVPVRTPRREDQTGPAWKGGNGG